MSTEAGRLIVTTEAGVSAGAQSRGASSLKDGGAPARAVRFLSGILPPLAVLVIAMAAWELWVTQRHVPRYIVPPPTALFERFLIDSDKLRGAFIETAVTALMGYAAAIAIGSAVAIVFSSSRLVQRCLYPYAVVLQTTPIIAVAPLIIIWAGPGRNAITIIAFIITVFPIIANSTLGLMSADHNMINLFRLNHASRVQELIKLRIPYAMPFVLAGLKVSAGLSVIGAIVGEFFAGTGGSASSLGALITFSASRLQIDMVFAAGLCASALGIGFFSIVSFAGNLALRNWHESATVTEN
jgi:NitT/TauT family transport system permease protein